MGESYTQQMPILNVPHWRDIGTRSNTSGPRESGDTHNHLVRAWTGSVSGNLRVQHLHTTRLSPALCLSGCVLNMDGMRFDSLTHGWRDVDQPFSITKTEAMMRDVLFRENLAKFSRSAGKGRSLRIPSKIFSPNPIPGSGDSVRWRISINDNILYGKLMLASSPYMNHSGWDLIRAMFHVLLTPPCKHESDNPAGDLAQHFDRTIDLRGVEAPDQRALLSTRRNYARHLSLLIHRLVNNGQEVVVHVEGCIRCALQLCLDSQCQVVIIR
jgi:hypothetical protein